MTPAGCANVGGGVSCCGHVNVGADGQIYDSRGNPTVEVDLYTEKGQLLPLLDGRAFS